MTVQSELGSEAHRCDASGVARGHFTSPRLRIGKLADAKANTEATSTASKQKTEVTPIAGAPPHDGRQHRARGGEPPAARLTLYLPPALPPSSRPPLLHPPSIVWGHFDAHTQAGAPWMRQPRYVWRSLRNQCVQHLRPTFFSARRFQCLYSFGRRYMMGLGASAPRAPRAIGAPNHWANRRALAGGTRTAEKTKGLYAARAATTLQQPKSACVRGGDKHSASKGSGETACESAHSSKRNDAGRWRRRKQVDDRAGRWMTTQAGG